MSETANARPVLFEVWNVNPQGRYVTAHARIHDPKLFIELVDWTQSPIRIRTFIERGRRRCRIVQFLAGRELAPGWQPIETAPKDGTRILVAWCESGKWQQRAVVWDAEANWVDDEGATALDGAYVGAWTDHAVESWGDQSERQYTPTHWQPLPAPPVVCKATQDAER